MGLFGDPDPIFLTDPDPGEPKRSDPYLQQRNKYLNIIYESALL